MAFGWLEQRPLSSTGAHHRYAADSLGHVRGDVLNHGNGRKVMQDATTMNRSETAKQKIEAALRAIDCALTERPQAIFEITTEDQLIRFKAELLKALHLISRGEIPELISHRKLGMARVITDQWPYNLSLGLIIIEAEHAFEAI
ncbi:hypothetical protein [Pseudomonas graminis]|uniref:hypothetical protein n=1 Tax=Pseudomonas graminis TaxID=158627 RepID=UPI00105EDCFB|nr:hypothetical protein [Pseudomonas graminis]